MSQTLAPLTTVDELQSFWRPMNDPGETNRATSLISTASNYLRQVANNNSVNIDEKIMNDGDGIFRESVKMVIMSAVKRAMLTPQDAPPVDTWTQSASPYSETMKFTNPSNDLYFKNSELQLLGLSSISGRSQFGALRGVK